VKTTVPKLPAGASKPVKRRLSLDEMEKTAKYIAAEKAKAKRKKAAAASKASARSSVKKGSTPLKPL